LSLLYWLVNQSVAVAQSAMQIFLVGIDDERH
jgi:hypothetical protein